MIGAAAILLSLVLAQSSASPSVTPAQAAPFLGEWTLAVTSQMGPPVGSMTLALSVAIEGGAVRAAVGGDRQPAVKVTDISLVNNNLLLRYSSDYQGTPIPTVMTLTPRGQDLLVNMSCSTASSR